MNKFLLTGLVIISLLTSGYTYQINQREIEKGQLILEEKQDIETQITQVEFDILEIEETISETEARITEEEKKQKEIEALIEALTKKGSTLQEKIEEYKEIAEGDPRVIITLDDPVVRAKTDELTGSYSTIEEKQDALFQYIRKEIEYVTEGNPKKYSYPRSFLQFKFDFWQLPRETIEWGSGDCEDYSILLCTMMRMVGVPAENVRVVLGVVTFPGGRAGHAWVEFKRGDQWYVLETTSPSWNYVTKARYYELFSPELWGWFNDQEHHVEESSGTGGFIGTSVYSPV